MEFADGATAVIESGWTLPPRWAGWREPGEWASFGDVRMDLVGAEGMASLDFRSMNVLGVDGEGWKYPDTRHWPVIHGLPSGALKEEVEHFLRCVMDGSPPVVDGVQAQRVTRVVAAAHLSLGEGRHVEVSI